MSEKHIRERDVGERWTSGSRIITITEVETFCNISGMRGDAFLSDEAARAAGLKGRVVPGALTFAAGISLMEIIIHGAVHVGTDKMRFLSPVYPYDKITAGVEVLNRKESSEGDRIFITYYLLLVVDY